MLLLNTTGSAANILSVQGTTLLEYSAIAGAALTINANAAISNDLAATAALKIGAWVKAENSNVYAENGEAGIGANSTVANIYAGGAANISASSVALTVHSVGNTGIATTAKVGDVYAKADVIMTGTAEAQNVLAGGNVNMLTGSVAQDVTAGGGVTDSGTITGTKSEYDVNAAFDVNAAVYDAAADGDVSDLLDILVAERIRLNNTYKAHTLTDDRDIQTGKDMYGDDYYTYDDENNETRYYDLETTIAASFDRIFLPGVYIGSSYTTGSLANIIFDGSGVDNPFWLFQLTGTFTSGADNVFNIVGVDETTDTAQVVWNTDAAINIGARTGIIGTTLSTAGATGGAGSFVKCGNLFSSADITITSVQSEDCLGSITVSDPEEPIIEVPEPTTLALFGLGLLGLGLRSRRKI